MLVALYKLRQVGNMLHRDVSSGNLMYRKVDGQFEVVLNDYDHAITLEPVQNTTHEVTGTWVFMAFDLVNTWPGEMIQHLVRFDIESAFYVFIWDSFMRIGQFPSILQGWREKPGSKHEVSLKSVDPKAEPLATVHPQLNKFFYRLCLAREEIWYLKMAHPEREITENMNGEFEPDFVLGILDEMKEAVRGAQGGWIIQWPKRTLSLTIGSAQVLSSIERSPQLWKIRVCGIKFEFPSPLCQVVVSSLGAHHLQYPLFRRFPTLVE